jgi:hypothetical protein
MNKTQPEDLPVSVPELAKRCGKCRRGLPYWWKTGQIPAPRHLGDTPYYTASEAAQIVEWFKTKRKLRFVP